MYIAESEVDIYCISTSHKYPAPCCEVTTEEVTAALFLAMKPGGGGGMLAPCSAGEKQNHCHQMTS